MTLAHSTPIIVGVGQFTERLGASDFKGLAAYEIAVRAAERAMDDALSLDRLRSVVDAIATTRTFEDSTPRRAQPFGKSNNFPHSIASRLGVEPRVVQCQRDAAREPVSELEVSRGVASARCAGAQGERAENAAADDERHGGHQGGLT